MSQAPSPILRSLGWAFVLACSWTWCIGMFLPILLVRDFGPLAWLVFALPNVIGAAAMGFVLTPESSRRFVERHRLACQSFGLVTISFHAYWITWIAGPMGLLILIPAVALALSIRKGTDATIAAAICWLASIGVVLTLAQSGELNRITGENDLANLAWLAVPCLLGFALCPYLDLTFHRARQETSIREGRWAFSIGFGIFFLLMILATPMYAGLLDQRGQMSLWVVVLLSHLLLQATFTIAVHWRSLLDAGRSNVAFIVIAIAIGFASAMLTAQLPDYRTMSASEVGYRVFMSFYGLIAPAYLMIGVASRLRVIGLLVAILLASPLYWIGFMDGQMIYCGIGGALVVVIAIGLRLLDPNAREHIV